MINYSDEYMKVFRTCSCHEDVLNHIHGISVTAKVKYGVSKVTPFVSVRSIKIKDNTPEFCMSVTIPGLFTDAQKTISFAGDVYKEDFDDGQYLCINISHSLKGIDELYTVDAELLLRNIVITPIRTIHMFDGPGVNITGGDNVSVVYTDNRIVITGDVVSNSVVIKPNSTKGLKSINGLRDSGNINIRMSSKLAQYGATIS